jgi:hypothetical protein
MDGLDSDLVGPRRRAAYIAQPSSSIAQQLALCTSPAPDRYTPIQRVEAIAHVYTHTTQCLLGVRELDFETTRYSRLSCLSRACGEVCMCGEERTNVTACGLVHPAQSELIQREQSLKLNMFEALPFAPFISINLQLIIAYHN